MSITIERRGEDDDIHVHAGGQGVWVARMAAELGAEPVVCGFAGGEPAVALRALLDRLPGQWRLTRTAAPTGCYVVDRRDGERRVVASAWATPPSRHELDDLISATCAAALNSRVLAVCNPFPGDSLPLDVYGRLVADVRQNGTPVLVDLSSPRLERALEGRPELVKLNDWELAEVVRAPVATPAEMDGAVAHLRDLGARTVVVTSGGDPCSVYRDDEVWRLVPPRFDRGAREGCGDAMMGALAAGWARGLDWRSALVTAAAAGAANFLRHGLGTGRRDVVEELARSVRLERRDQDAANGTAGSSPRKQRGRRRLSDPAQVTADPRDVAQAGEAVRELHAPAPGGVMGVAAHDVHEPAGGQGEHRRPRPLVGQQSGGHLDERAGADERRQPVAEVLRRVALGMGDDAPQAARRQGDDDRVQAVGERARSRLEQDPAPAAAQRDRAATRRPSARAPSPRRPRRRSATRTASPSRRTASLSAATRSGSSAIRTSWSARMWGVAQTTAIPSASA